MLKLALNRSKFFILALVVILSGMLSILTPPQQASAVTTGEIEGTVKKYLNYQALLSCMTETSNGADFDEIKNWGFFDNHKQSVGHIISAADGMISCQDGGWVRGVLGEYGYTDPLVFLCAAGWNDGSQGTSDVPCTSSPALVPPINNKVNLMKNALLKGGAEPNINDVDNYYLFSQTFIIGCKANNLGEYSTATPINQAVVNTDTGYKLQAPNENYAVTEYIYQAELGKGRNITLRSTGNGGGVMHTCIDLTAQAAKYVLAYINAIKPGLGQPGTCGEKYIAGPLGSQAFRDACDAGLANKADPNYCNKYTDADIRNACLYGQTATGDSNSTSAPLPTPGTTAGTKKTSCNIVGIGWMVCPILNFAAGLIDGAYGFIANLLTIQPILQDGNSKGIYDAWSIMRNFANVVFVIAFLIIIFSQVTSAGITNYGIKRLLPRIIVAAILVNVSYWICAAAVDISNILGASIKGVFETVGANIAFLQPSTDGVTTGSNTWANIVGTVITSAIVGAALYLSLAALVPMLFISLIIVIAVFVALVLRQVLVILLIVVSPLAFVAYLLPGTESLFTKWRTMFQMLLLMYPTIAFLFGASALASVIIKGSGL